MVSLSVPPSSFSCSEVQKYPPILPFVLIRAIAHVILSGARDSARREGPAFPRVAADLSSPHDEFEQQVLRACGAQDDRLYALLEKEKKEERATRRTCFSSCRSGSLLSS
jgi:hypothetical protein